jgi:hypothetical protein
MKMMRGIRNIVQMKMNLLDCPEVYLVEGM